MIPFVGIRRAGVDDVPKVLVIDHAIPEAPHWSEAIYYGYVTGTADALQRKTLFIAGSGERLDGFAAASFVAEEAELESMAVDERVRRSGLGSKLLDAVKQWACSHKAGRLRLEVRAANMSARAFYLSQGFRADGLRRGYYNKPIDDAVLMSLDLMPCRSPGE